MSIIEQATKRLEELSRAGVSVPWAAAGLAQSEVQARVESNRRHPPMDSTPVAAVRRVEADLVSVGRASPRPLHTPDRSTFPSGRRGVGPVGRAGPLPLPRPLPWALS